MGNGKIGGKIVLDGEKEYREALKGIASGQKELRSEMQLCAAAYKESQNSTEALREKQEILAKQYEKQEEKVKICAKAQEEYAKKQEEAQKKVNDLSEEYALAEKELTEMTKASDASKEAIEGQKKKIEELGGKLSLAKEGYEKNTQSAQRWNTSLNYAQKELIDLQRELGKTETCLEEAEQSTDGCATSIDQYGKSTKEATQQSAALNKNASEAINAIAGVLAATGIAKGAEQIADALKDCSENAKNFNTDMAKVSTVADMASVSLAQMSKDILGTSSELGVAAGEITEATYNAISASVDTAKAVGFAGQATKLAIGGFTEAVTSVDILTTIINAYKLETEDATKASDMLVTTQNLGKTTVGELATNMGKVIPLAASYNVQLDNLSTTYALLTANGIATAEATTYIKAMFGELGDSGSAVGKVLIQETGKSFGTLMNSGSSLGDIIQILGRYVKQDAAEFNALWSSSEAGIGALSLLGAGGEKFNEVLGKMNDSAGATEEAFAKMADTTKAAENRFITSIDNLKIAIGNELNPKLEEMYEVGTQAVGWATEFIEENPELVSAITALVVGIGVLAVGIAGATVAVVAFNAAVTLLSANPWILITGAVIAAAAALATLVVMSDNSTDSTKKQIEANEKEIAALKENVIARQEARDGFVKESEELNRLKSKVVELNAKEVLNTEQKADMLAAVSRLNDAMPELNLKINENTGKIDGNTEALEGNIEAQARLYELEFLQEDQKQAASDRYDAEQKLVEITKERQKALEELKAIEAEWAANANASNGITLEGFQTIKEGIPAYERISKEIETMDAQMAACRETISTTSQEFEDATVALEDTKIAMQSTGDASVEYKDKIYNDVAPDVVASIKSIQTQYEEAKKEAYDSMTQQVGLFDELSTKSELSAAEMAENLKTQTETFTQYSSDLRTAAELMKADTTGNFTKIVESIMGMGMEGSGYLRELVSAAEESSGKFADVVASFGAMEEAKDNLSETMGDIKENYSAQLDGLLGVTEEKYLDMQTNITDTYQSINEEIVKAVEEMKQTTDGGILDIASGVSKNAKQVVNAAELMCTDVETGINTRLSLQDGTYMAFHQVGILIDQSIAKGITEGKQNIAGALQQAVNEAIDSIDLSGITGKINRSLGGLM